MDGGCTLCVFVVWVGFIQYAPLFAWFPSYYVAGPLQLRFAINWCFIVRYCPRSLFEHTVPSNIAKL